MIEAGWKLQIFREINRSARRGIEVVQVFGMFGGQCRPFQVQAFVFLNDRLIGTLLPRLMDARSDGYLTEVSVSSLERSWRRFSGTVGKTRCAAHQENRLLSTRLCLKAAPTF